MSGRSRLLSLPAGRGICYSGYRAGQSPATRVFPSLEEIRQDLHLLAPHWQLLRLYDCSVHAERVLQVIRQDGLDLRVLLGAHLGPEISNPACPWGGIHSEEALAASRAENLREVERLGELANAYRDSVWAVAVGNEAAVDWSDHRVPVESLVAHVRRARSLVAQPVTFCENYVPWQQGLQALAAELDFISLHSYPVWEYRSIDQALGWTQANLASVRAAHPGHPVVITEAGWTTRSNGRGIEPHNASVELQLRYLHQLLDWCERDGILSFVFEAFDEPWKGSDDLHEPEKHWGLFTVDRCPKPAVQHWYPELLTGPAQAR